MTESSSGTTRSRLLSPDEIAIELQALSAIVQLMLLDRYWTAEAGRPAASRADLTPVVDDMTRLIKEIESLAPKVAAISTAHAGELDPAFKRKLDQRPGLRSKIQERGGDDISASARRFADDVARLAPSEIAHLEEENARIRAELASAGDVSVEFAVVLEVGGYHIEVSGGIDTGEGLIGAILGALFG